MGSIPLVALAENPQPTPQNPLVPMEQAAQVQGQRTSNQQAQVALKQQQLQLQDQETLRDLMPQFVKKGENGSPSGYDFNGLIQAAQGKVLPQTLFALQQQQSTMRQSAATATKDELANQDTLNKNLYQRVEGLRGLTDPNDRQSHYQDTIMYAQQHGIGTNDWPAQAPTNDQLDGVEAELGMHAQTLADQKTAAEATEAAGKGKQAAAEAQKANRIEFPALGVWIDADTGQQHSIGGGPVMSPEMMQSKYVGLAAKRSAGQPIAAEDADWMKGYEKMKTLVPTANINLQRGLLTPEAEAMAANLYQQTGQLPTGMRSPAMSSQILNAAAGPQGAPTPDIAGNKRNYVASTALEKSATSGEMGKQITAYNTAIAHAQQLQNAADALDNGDVRGLNKIGTALGYQFGSDKTTNFNVIKNALSGEISKVFKGGEASDAEIKAVQEPFSTANSPAQLKGAIQNAITLMNSKRDALKQQYEQGMQGKPNFGGESGEITATGPNGHKIAVRGGRWVDAQTGQPIQ